MLNKTLTAIIVALTAAGAASAQHDGYRAPIPPTAAILQLSLADAMNGIQRESLRQRSRDGGELTAAHRDALQLKADNAMTRYASQMRRYGFFGPAAN